MSQRRILKEKKIKYVEVNKNKITMSQSYGTQLSSVEKEIITLNAYIRKNWKCIRSTILSSYLGKNKCKASKRKKITEDEHKNLREKTHYQYRERNRGYHCRLYRHKTDKGLL